MTIRITLSVVALASVAGACEQNPVRALPSGSPAAAVTVASAAGAPIYGGTENDYQPSLIRAADGRLMIVLERLAPRTNSGDLYVSTSTDAGASWSVPSLIVGTRLNERHPALVQHANGAFSLFYLQVDRKGGYSIQRATSADGTTWTRHGAIDLGWGASGDMNPSVVLEGDGSLTMTYQRPNGAGEYVGYIARSMDGGVTWDGLKTTVSDGTGGMLPRVAKRASDGRYMVTFQAEGPDGVMAIYAKTSAGVYDWNVPRFAVSQGENAHDSQPIVLEDGRFFVTYGAVRSDAGYNIYYRTTADAATWGGAVQVTSDSNLHDVQPHPILHGTAGHVILSWGRQRAAGADWDIWVNPDLAVQ